MDGDVRHVHLLGAGVDVPSLMEGVLSLAPVLTGLAVLELGPLSVVVVSLGLLAGAGLFFFLDPMVMVRTQLATRKGGRLS